MLRGVTTEVGTAAPTRLEDAGGVRRAWALLLSLSHRELRHRYKGSALGVVWALILPLVMVLAYTLVFSVLWRVVSVPHYAFFVATGIAAWVIFSGCLTAGGASLTGNAELIKQVRFNRMVLPISATASQLFTAAVLFVIVMPFNIIWMPGTRWALVLAPVALIAMLLFAFGLTLMLAGLNVYLRDAEYLVAAILQPLFFLTPIFWVIRDLPLAQENPWVATVVTYANPVSPFVLTIQDTMFWGNWPGLGILTYSVVGGALTFAVGVWVFRRLERDVVAEL
jgi:lipopolysaccharide transport system permease protein